jgi:hypothetical protein
MHTALLSHDEAAVLLETPLDELAPAPVVARVRRPRWALMVGGAIGSVFLLITLPANYLAQNWPAISVGLDVLLVAFMAMTAALVFLRPQWVPLTAFTTGALLICDAWFDVMAAAPHDLWASALTATLIELPLGVILIATVLRTFATDHEAVVAR